MSQARGSRAEGRDSAADNQPSNSRQASNPASRAGRASNTAGQSPTGSALGEQTPQPRAASNQVPNSRQSAADQENLQTPSRAASKQTAQSRQSQGNQEVQQYRMSNRSQGAISRTPSADRRLLRALTVSPNLGEIDDGDDATPEPQYSAPQSVQARQSTRLSAVRSQAETQVGSPNQASPSRASSVLDIPPVNQREAKGDEWQANKTVPQANSYMLKYEVACDVTFNVGESKEEIRAHKYMLMARSPVLFKSLIKHLGNTDVKIGVPDIKPDCFRDMLQYIYTDEFDIHSDNVTTMLFAAKKFQLKGLTNLCFQYLDAEMHDETVCKIMEQAHIYSETGLYDKCLRFILTNGTVVLKKAGFSELCSECVAKIIKSDDLRADEDAVFEGCMTWANMECRRQKKQPTDEARREVLGKLLYYIRFPIMDVTYFTQKVSLGNLLSHDETLSIFQYFHGEEQQLPNRFNKNDRNRFPRAVNENMEPMMLSSRSPSTARARRFPTTDGEWKQNGPPDAISFTVSNPIVLYGIEIFGVAHGKETYAMKLFVYDDITREEIRKNDANIYTNSIKETYEVFLTRPLRIPAKRVFTVMVMMRGNPTHKGVDGEKSLIADDVQFEFTDSNRSSNGTDVNVGQIAGILFNKTQ